MEAESVHQWQEPATRAIPGSESGEKTHRRGGHVARRCGPVVAAGSEPEADHADRRIDCLERVVARSEIGAGGCGRDVRSVRPKLRAQECGLVGLVHDDELLDAGVSLGDERKPGRERLRCCDPVLHLARRIRIHGQRDPQPGKLRQRHRAIECVPVLDRQRIARHEPGRHHGLLQPERSHLREEHCAGVGSIFSGVVVRADIGSRSATCDHERRHRDGRCHSSPHGSPSFAVVRCAPWSALDSTPEKMHRPRQMNDQG